MIASPWLRVWTRAVIGPAYRRAGAVWIGTAIAAAVIFGPTGLTPWALTQLALHGPGVGIALAATWLLMFVPVARIVVRADAATYLRALPGPTLAPLAIAGAALIGLQLPWLVLWVWGQGALGLAIVCALTVVIVALAWLRFPPPRAGWPRWTGARQAFTAIYVRALRRRAGDGIVRGIGLAVLAGAAGGLVVANNQLVGQDAAVLGTAVIAVVALPAQVGLLSTLVNAYRASGWLAASLGVTAQARIAGLAVAVGIVYLVDAYRASGWLAASLGVTAQARIAGLAVAVGIVYLTCAVVGVGALAIVVGGNAETIAWVAAFALPTALLSALAVTRSLVRAADSPSAAQRVVSGAVVVAALAVFWLGLLGELGLAAMAATAIVALARTEPR
jgi:hypothetical protein